MPQMINADDLVGTWILIRAEAVDAQGRDLPPPYGPEPLGRVVFERRGRMMAVLGDGRTTVPAGVRRAFVAYCGNFTIEHDQLMTTVDAASLKGLIGNVEIRRIEMHDGRLVLIPPPHPSGEQRRLTWQRCSAE
jgi:hypothetical protein